MPVISMPETIPTPVVTEETVVESMTSAEEFTIVSEGPAESPVITDTPVVVPESTESSEEIEFKRLQRIRVPETFVLPLGCQLLTDELIEELAPKFVCVKPAPPHKAEDILASFNEYIQCVNRSGFVDFIQDISFVTKLLHSNDELNDFISSEASLMTRFQTFQYYFTGILSTAKANKLKLVKLDTFNKFWEDKHLFSSSQIIVDLKALREEFEFVGYKRDSDTLFFITEPIRMGCVLLGRYQIQLHIPSLKTNDTLTYERRPYKIYPETLEMYFPGLGIAHPHLYHDGRICEGQNRNIFNTWITTGNYFDLFSSINTILHTYNAKSVTCELINFVKGITQCYCCDRYERTDISHMCRMCAAYNCSECTKLPATYFLSNCQYCSSIICKNCKVSCSYTSCSRTICRQKCSVLCTKCQKNYACHASHLLTCARCSDRGCMECVTKCYSCTVRFCSNCKISCSSCKSIVCINCSQDGICCNCISSKPETSSPDKTLSN